MEKERTNLPAGTTLSGWLSENAGRIRNVHVVSGAPDYYGGRRNIRKAHGTIRYKGGLEAFRSKSVTDGMLAARLVRTVKKQAGSRQDVTAVVFMPYGKKKKRPWHERDMDKPAEPAGGYIRIPDGIDDELPF